MLFTSSLITDSPIRQKIREFYRIDENVGVDHILPFAEVNVSARSRAWERARRIVLKIRDEQSGKNYPRRVQGISVKLSAIYPRYKFTHKSRVMDEIVPKLKVLCIQAKQYNIGLTVDAEESERLEINLYLQALIREYFKQHTLITAKFFV